MRLVKKKLDMSAPELYPSTPDPSLPDPSSLDSSSWESPDPVPIPNSSPDPSPPDPSLIHGKQI